MEFAVGMIVLGLCGLTWAVSSGVEHLAGIQKALESIRDNQALWEVRNSIDRLSPRAERSDPARLTEDNQASPVQQARSLVATDRSL